MRLIKKIFHNFFLLKFVLISLFFSKIILANNADDSNLPILKRLPTSIFATINGDPMSIFDLIQRSNLFSISAKIPIDENFEIKILPDLISGYIDEIIQMQEIKKENILVADDQVQQTISKIEKGNQYQKGELKKILKENKTNISILEKQIIASIGWKQLIANKFRTQVIIQDSEIDLLHEQLISSIGKEEFFIEQIFISFENKDEIEVKNKISNLHNQVLSGGNFLSIAKQFSESFAGKTGNIGWVSELDLDKTILSKIKKLEIKKPSEPLRGENGYFIIKVLNKRIIGEEKISQVSLFKFKLLNKNTKTLSTLNKINNCDELKEFSKKYGSVDSGSLGNLNFDELSINLKNEIKKTNKNGLTKPIDFGNEKFQIMVCDIKKTKPIVPSKFKIMEILMSKKLDTIAKQYMSELRSKAIIDIRI